MATVIVTHRVSDYDRWRPAFDQDAPQRKKAKLTSWTVHRDHADPNLLTIIMKTNDLDAAKRFADSPELRDVMQSAGVEGPPDIKMLDDV